MADENIDDTKTAEAEAAAAAEAAAKEAANKLIEDGPPKTNAQRMAETAAAQKAAEEKAAADKVAEEEAAAEKAKAEEVADDEELDTEVWGDTGSDTGNAVLVKLQSSGIKPEEAKALLYDAVLANDITKIDVAALEAKVGKATATLVLAGIKDVVETNKTRVAEVMAIATSAAGSKENWDAVTGWAKAGGVSKDDMVDLIKMLDKGGKQAEFAAKDIVSMYNADKKNTTIVPGEKAIVPGKKNNAPAVEGISRQTYGVEILKLNRKRASPAEYAALTAKRNAGIAQGL